MLFANSTAILTDAFPADQRGMALGINQVAAIAGSFIGLVARRRARRVELARGVLGQRADRHPRHRLGLPVAARASAPRPTGADRLVGQPHLRGRPDRAAGRRSPTASSRTAATRTGWTNPWVLAGLIGGVAAARASSCVIETARRRADVPPRACSGSGRSPAGNVAGLLASIARGGLQFMLIIWLQGIWLPLHGYDYESHAAVGRHLPAAADRRLPGRRADRPARSPTGSAPGCSPPAACCVDGRCRSSACCCSRSTSPTGCSRR